MSNAIESPAPRRALWVRADWRLTVEGSVAKPSSFSLEDLKRMGRSA